MTSKQREYQLELRLRATPSEIVLLGMLDAHPATHGRFKFQECICGYFPDFANHSARLILELDGAVHRGLKNRLADARRTRKLARAGWRVIRFWNSDLRNPQWVMQRILLEMRQMPSAQAQAPVVPAPAQATQAPAMIVNFSFPPPC